MKSKTSPALKFCGISNVQDAQIANEIKPEYVGFVLWESSKRAVSKQEAHALRRVLDDDITCVGVFVDEEVDHIVSCVKEGIIQVVQLHGNETESTLACLRDKCPGLEIWQAFVVRNTHDITRANASSADMVLVDGGKGEGEVFDWDLLKGLTRPFVLAGGLTCENVCEAIRAAHPSVVDVSSGIECKSRAPDGRTLKDHYKMLAFARCVRGEVQ